MSAITSKGSRVHSRRAAPRRSWWPVVFVGPAVLGFLVFILLPLIMTVVFSFTDYDLFGAPTFAGTSNYEQMLGDSRLWQTYLNTALFTFGAVPLNVGIALLLAVALNTKMPKFLQVTLRSAFFMPSLVGLIFVAIVWQFFFQNNNGIFNYYLEQLNFAPVPWLSDPHWVIPSIILLDVWKNIGLAMLILLAALQGIPKEYYEASSLDGANGIRQFRHITLPLLSPQLFFVLTLYLIGAVKVFDSIVVLTNGGPGDASRSIVMYIYEKAFKSFDFGYASAISVTLLIVIAALTWLQFKGSKRWVHYA